MATISAAAVHAMLYGCLCGLKGTSVCMDWCAKQSHGVVLHLQDTASGMGLRRLMCCCLKYVPQVRSKQAQTISTLADNMLVDSTQSAHPR